ncbi:LD-carboxypeptidase [bacterium]|nr:LD-carboxypeptidase [bacterium]
MTLEKGDKIGIIALSGDCEKRKVEIAKLNFVALGYRVELSDNIYSKTRYLAGSDEFKIDELHRLYEDPEIKLILAARGGYGAIRLINNIDYDLIRNNPKPLCGFSDVTALLLMIYKNTGVITYHSPMACTDFGVEVPSYFTTENFFNALNQDILEFEGEKIYADGQAEGIIWGGNLATTASLCGQDFIPDNDFIFFTEDISEPVYKIDRMFNQLFNIDKFQDYCKGIVLGDFLGVDSQIWLEDFFTEFSRKHNIPIVSGFKISHDKYKITIPVGVNANLDGLKLTLNK